MKIAHIAPPWIAIPPKNYGGTENVLHNLIEEQVAQGHDVTLLAPGDARTSARLVSFFPKSLVDSGIPWPAHLKAYYHVFKAVEYVRTHTFDIVHTHLSSSSDMYVFPLTASLNTPLITTLHSRFPFDRVQSWTGDADYCYLDWLSSVPLVAISASAQAEVPHKLNFIGVVHHGLPTETFRPTTLEPEDFLVWLGRIIPDKGTHLAIRAAKAAGMPLVIAGNVDRHLPEAVRYFEEMVQPELDDRHVKYIGPVNMEQKIALLSKARGFLNPIQWEEPFGMVMIEAMALGCPVISFARGAAPEVVSHGKSGFLVHDVNEMVQYIPRLAQLERREVRAYVEQNFSAKVMAEKYTRLYKRVIASKLQSTTLPLKAAQKAATTPGVRPLLPERIKISDPVVGGFPTTLAPMPTVEAEQLS